MTSVTSDIRLCITLHRGDERVDVFKDSLPWIYGPRPRVDFEIGLASAGFENTTLGLTGSKGLLGSIGGFVVLTSDAQNRVCWSFCCLPKSSQSMSIRIAESIIEIMLTSDVERPI